MFLKPSIWAISPQSILREDIAKGMGNENRDKVRVRSVGFLQQKANP